MPSRPVILERFAGLPTMPVPGSTKYRDYIVDVACAEAAVEFMKTFNLARDYAFAIDTDQCAFVMVTGFRQYSRTVNEMHSALEAVIAGFNKGRAAGNAAGRAELVAEQAELRTLKRGLPSRRRKFMQMLRDNDLSVADPYGWSHDVYAVLSKINFDERIAGVPDDKLFLLR